MIVTTGNAGINACCFRRKFDRRFGWVLRIIIDRTRKITEESGHFNQARMLDLECDKAVRRVEIVSSRLARVHRTGEGKFLRKRTIDRFRSCVAKNKNRKERKEQEITSLRILCELCVNLSS